MRCGTQEHIGTGVSMWNHRDVFVQVESFPSEFDRPTFEGIVEDWIDAIQAVCGIQLAMLPKNTRNVGNIVITARRLDGPGGVLGDMELPPASSRDTSRVQRVMRLDEFEDFTVYEGPIGRKFMDIYRVGLHEMIHGIGVGHSPEQSLMAPTVGNIRKPVGWDIRQMQARYPLRPQAPSPSPPQGSPSNDRIVDELAARLAGACEAFAKALTHTTQ